MSRFGNVVLGPKKGSPAAVKRFVPPWAGKKPGEHPMLPLRPPGKTR